MRVNQNITAFNAYRNLSASNASMSKTLEKLSSGTRINRAGDDAAGLVISQGLRAQVGGLRQAARNAQDGISVVQTAEGALNEVHNMLGRMRDLAVQASNSGSNDINARKAAQAEVGQLQTEIDQIAGQTKFGSTQLLNGTYGLTAAKATGGAIATTAALTATLMTLRIDNNVTSGTIDLSAITVDTTDQGTTDASAAAIQTKIRAALAADTASGNRDYADKVNVTGSWAAGSSTFSVSIEGLPSGKTFTSAASGNLALGAATNASGSGGTFQVGANGGETINVNIAKMDTSNGGLNVNVDLVSSASSAIASIDAAIAKVSAQRGDLGAKQNRFESRIANLNVATENLSASESRIRDTDYASEMVSFTRGQIMNQVGTAMLAQANQLPQGVLSLLRG
jgi:flagellin